MTTERRARCQACERTAPSHPSLAFFIDRGPGSADAANRCVNDGYARQAHERKAALNEPHLRHLCDNFTPNPNGLPFDSYYCGCRGWD